MVNKNSSNKLNHRQNLKETKMNTIKTRFPQIAVLFLIITSLLGNINTIMNI